MQGLPAEWLHANDELYGRMRGSADHMHVLSSSFSKPEFGGTDMHEPMVWYAPFGKGRVVTTSMGHMWTGDTNFDGPALRRLPDHPGSLHRMGRDRQGHPGRTEGFPTLDKTSVIEPSKVVWKK